MKGIPLPRLTFILLAAAWGSISWAGEVTGANDHVLFVGSDFAVVKNGHEQPVLSAGNRTFVIMDGSRRRELPLQALPDIRIHRGLKLTCLTASIDQLNVVLSSDAINAEQKEATLNSMALSTVADMQRDHAYGQMIDQDVGRGSDGSSLSRLVKHATIIAEAEGKQLTAANSYLQAESLRTQQSDFLHDQIDTHGAAATNDGDEVEITPDVSAGRVGLSVAGQVPHAPVENEVNQPKPMAQSIVDTGNGRSDHLDLSFTVAAPERLDGAYAVITTEFTIPNSGETFRRILTQSIGRIDASPRKVSVYETGYPEGFHLRTYVVSIYVNGQEVATNLSPSQLRMTAEEAYQYIFVDYLASHKGQSLPPAAVLMAPRSRLSAGLPGVESSPPVYVSVDEAGIVTGVSADPKRAQRPDSMVSAALQNFRFIPALEKGVPVRGRAKLVVSDFLRH